MQGTDDWGAYTVDEAALRHGAGVEEETTDAQMPATGKSVNVQAIDILRFGDDGLAHEHWGVFDAMAMMQQLGLVPEGAPQ